MLSRIGMIYQHHCSQILSLSVTSAFQTHLLMVSNVYFPLFSSRWQKGRAKFPASQVHSPKGSTPLQEGVPTFLQVTANLSLQPQDVDPVNSLQVEQLASMMGLPDFFSSQQSGPQSMTSKLADLPARLQLMVEPHLNLWESAAQQKLQLPQDFPQAVCWSQKEVRQQTLSAGMLVQAVAWREQPRQSSRETTSSSFIGFCIIKWRLIIGFQTFRHKISGKQGRRGKNNQFGKQRQEWHQQIYQL